MQRFAARHRLYLTIELDRCIDGEDYEEVVAFHEPATRQRRGTLWRSAEHLVVERPAGPAARFARLDEALATLRP